MLLALAAAMCAPAVAGAADRYAAVGGTGDPAFCSSAEPCDIQDAVESFFAQNGDRVLLEAGTYELGSDELSAFLELDIGPAGDGPVTIRNQGATAVRLADGGAIHDLTIEVDAVACCTTAGVNAQNGAEVSDLLIMASNAAVGVIVNADASVRGTRIYSEERGILGGNGTVEDTTVVSASTAMTSSSAYGGGPLVVNNTVLRSANPELYVTNCAGGTSFTAEIRISYSNWRTSDSQPCETPGPVTDLGHNQEALPLLADPAAGDFHQLPGSPTIDAGTASGATVDFDGDPRVQGAAQDIGADEYGGPDGDGVGPEDNCPDAANPDQTDKDGDGLGDACDDIEVDGAVVKAKKRQKQRGKKIRVKVKAGAAEAVDATLTGKLVIKKRARARRRARPPSPSSRRPAPAPRDRSRPTSSSSSASTTARPSSTSSATRARPVSRST